MVSEPAPLARLRLLVVEDEFLLSVIIAEDLAGAGATVLGPFGDLETALAASARERFDCAVLDINLRGTMVFPLADRLLDRGVPFLFVSGYGAEQLPTRFQPVPRLGKPYEPAILIRTIAGMM